ncbi:MAG: tetratricopeptide repeat protein [Hydrogenovibrio sp.]|nr:tetratricopeptide repeat protein [Hydrogenovibrio sp.]
MKRLLWFFVVMPLLIWLSGCSSHPSKPSPKMDPELLQEQTKPLATKLTEEDEYLFGLDLADLQIKNKQLDRAEKLLVKLKKFKPEDVRVYRLYTRFYDARQNLEMAYLSSKQALKMKKSSRLDQQRFAKYALLNDHYAEAEKVYRDWLDQDDQQSLKVVALNNLGFSALLQKQYHRAHDYFQQALKIDPLNEKARNNLKLIASVKVESGSIK